MGDGRGGEADEEGPIFRRMKKGQRATRRRKRESDGEDTEPDLDITQSRKVAKGIFVTSKRTIDVKMGIVKPSSTYERSLDDVRADGWDIERDGEGSMEMISGVRKASKSRDHDDPLVGDDAELATKIYKGLKGYDDPLREALFATQIKYGPKKCSTNVKFSSRFDYQPDICKDYKETGYCGYGDSCVFLHDRGEYKPSWKMDMEWEEAQRNATKEEEKGDDGSNDLLKGQRELPFACLICRKSFLNPFKTRCNHYFCEKCVTEWSRKSKRCFACGLITNGVILPAHEIQRKLISEGDSVRH